MNRWSASCKPLDRTAGRLVLTEGNQGNEAPWPKVIPLELGRTRLRPAVSRGLGTDSTQLGLTFESGRAPALQGRATRRHRHACSRSWIALSGRRGRWAMGFRGRCPRLRWDQAFGLSYTNADGRTSPGQASFISHSRSLAFIRGLPHSESPPSLSASIAFPGGGGGRLARMPASARDIGRNAYPRTYRITSVTLKYVGRPIPAPRGPR